MGQVVSLDSERKKRSVIPPHPLPEALSLAQVEHLLRRSMAWKFTHQEVQYAWITVKDWAAARGSKAYRADWVAVIMNSMRQGWGLKGFEKYAAKRGGVTRGTRITEDGIQHTLTRLRRNGRT